MPIDEISRSVFCVVFFAGILLAYPCAAETPADMTEVSRLLMQSRWSHEPRAVIVKAVQLLDAMLDGNPKELRAWLRLAEALAIDSAQSRHAKSPADAWRQAYALDRSDCHVGALAAWDGDQDAKAAAVGELKREHPQCPEALYLSASLAKPGSEARVDLLRGSIALKPSAEAEVALAQELAVAGDMPGAVEKYSAALSAATLFPEDWRPDGRVAVHAHLGLAWARYKMKQPSAARREFKKFLSWFNEPGPWHDLSDTEDQWRIGLDARFSRGSGRGK